jgi:dihydroorotate dehydrogenase electron transfer subunit
MTVGHPGEHVARIAGQETLAPGIYLLTLEAPELALAVQPGQFAMVGCGCGYDPFMRRPFSIHQADRQAGTVNILYRVAGAGTSWLAARRSGEPVSLLGPLGRGFRYAGKNGAGGMALLVGAGIGAAPLLFLAEELAALPGRLAVLLGARTTDEILRRPAFERCGEVLAITDDGSSGRRGTVVDLLAEALSEGSWSQVYACGPKPVLQAVRRISLERGVPAQLSLEERMACGLGACMGCACQGAGGRMLRVCAEGPVFDADEVILDDGEDDGEVILDG